MTDPEAPLLRAATEAKASTPTGAPVEPQADSESLTATLRGLNPPGPRSTAQTVEELRGEAELPAVIPFTPLIPRWWIDVALAVAVSALFGIVLLGLRGRLLAEHSPARALSARLPARSATPTSSPSLAAELPARSEACATEVRAAAAGERTPAAIARDAHDRLRSQAHTAPPSGTAASSARRRTTSTPPVNVATRAPAAPDLLSIRR